MSCIACVIVNKSHIFPFTLETDGILLGLTVAELPLVDSLPTLEILSNLQNLPNLSDYDIDENIEPNINCDYLNVQEMQVLEVSPNAFKLQHLNVRSLTLHFDELFSLLGGTGINFQVIGLSEIKVSVNSPISTNINIPGYNFHHTPSLSAAGGVGIYVNSLLKANKRLDLSTNTCDFETVWIEIENAKLKNILCCCAYRHPSSEVANFNNHIQELLSILANENKTTFIMGDFNLNLLNSENHALTSDFINTMFANHFQPLILHPTRVTDSSATLIDNIFSNDVSCTVTSGNILIQSSDHFPHFSIHSNSAPDLGHCSYLAYDYKNFNQSKCLDDYLSLDFTFLDGYGHAVNHNFDKVLSLLNQLIDKHCPKKKLNKKSLKLKNTPWINNQIQKMMRIRDRLLQQSKLTDSCELYTYYKQFCNRVVNELKNSKKNYFQTYFAENKSNMKQFLYISHSTWRGLFCNPLT